MVVNKVAKSISIDQDLFSELQYKSEKTGKNFSDCVNEAIKNWLHPAESDVEDISILNNKLLLLSNKLLLSEQHLTHCIDLEIAKEQKKIKDLEASKQIALDNKIQRMVRVESRLTPELIEELLKLNWVNPPEVFNFYVKVRKHWHDMDKVALREYYDYKKTSSGTSGEVVSNATSGI
jgi:hypothetical protein